jgi:hypothetical protein
MARLTEEQIAAELRKTYWAEVGESRGPWAEASPESQRAWVQVVRRMHSITVISR